MDSLRQFSDTCETFCKQRADDCKNDCQRQILQDFLSLLHVVTFSLNMGQEFYNSLTEKTKATIVVCVNNWVEEIAVLLLDNRLQTILSDEERAVFDDVYVNALEYLEKIQLKVDEISPIMIQMRQSGQVRRADIIAVESALEEIWKYQRSWADLTRGAIIRGRQAIDMCRNRIKKRRNVGIAATAATTAVGGAVVGGAAGVTLAVSRGVAATGLIARGAGIGAAIGGGTGLVGGTIWQLKVCEENMAWLAQKRQIMTRNYQVMNAKMKELWDTTVITAKHMTEFSENMGFEKENTSIWRQISDQPEIQMIQ